MAELEAVRLGVIGPSWWVDYWHMAAIRAHPAAKLVAICGQRERSAEQIQASYGAGVGWFGTWDEMLSAAPLDGVIVCTPNDLHCPASMACLARDLHVNCEKPLALNAVQAKEMVDAAKWRSRLAMCNFPYRDNPNIGAFKTLVTEGYLGRLLHIRGEYNGGFGLRNSPNWRSQQSRSGAGILGDLGSHLIDLMRYVTGLEFQEVIADSLTLVRDPSSLAVTDLTRTGDARVPERNDDSTAFLARLHGGAQALLHTSWVSIQGGAVQHQEIEAFGTDGRLHFVSSHDGTRLRGKRQGDRTWEPLSAPGAVTPEELQAPDEDAFRPGRHGPTNTTYRWIEAIRAGAKSISPSFEDGLRAQEVIDAVVRSSAERHWVGVAAD